MFSFVTLYRDNLASQGLYTSVGIGTADLLQSTIVSVFQTIFNVLYGITSQCIAIVLASTAYTFFAPDWMAKNDKIPGKMTTLFKYGYMINRMNSLIVGLQHVAQLVRTWKRLTINSQSTDLML